MDIITPDYSIHYHPDSSTLELGGTLRLAGTEEYAPINNLLLTALDTQPKTLILNLRKLEFLNSSGINMLSKFVIKVRQQAQTQLVLLGSAGIPWQTKSLKNLQRLLPQLDLQIE